MDRSRPKPAILIAPLLLAGGLALDWILERHNIFKLWENSSYPISWADMFYPPLCLWICLTGIMLLITRQPSAEMSRGVLLRTVALALPLVVLYTIVLGGMQFVASGADRLGECPDLDHAAARSNVIPESQWWKGRPAVGCAVERRGVFLSSYNDLAVYGVTEKESQQRVVDEVSKQYRQAHTHPVQIRFFDRENVITDKRANGVVFQKAGPTNLIRVVNIG